jgi:hypothetical protein
MTGAVALAGPAADPGSAATVDDVVETAILRFLNGEIDGRTPLNALYDGPLDEPIPERMLALVRGYRPA